MTPVTSSRKSDIRSGIPKIGFCLEKEDLVLRFSTAVVEMIALQKEQMQAVIDGHPDAPALDLLRSAIRQKDDAKYALLGHMEWHQC